MAHKIELEIERLSALREAPRPKQCPPCAKRWPTRVNLVVAKAAKIAAGRGFSETIPDLRARLRPAVRKTGGARPAMLGQDCHRQRAARSGASRIRSLSARCAPRADGTRVGRPGGYGAAPARRLPHGVDCLRRSRPRRDSALPGGRHRRKRSGGAVEAAPAIAAMGGRLGATCCGSRPARATRRRR